MKKKNNSGFTLVELIIVVALLAIMMGAILRLLDPIRSVYKDTYDTVNTKTVGETMISYVEDRVRYSTNVLVLENYVGVPKITPIPGKSSAKVGTSKYEYTNVIVVDNTNIRGSMFSDYKGDTGTTYARKNCKGCIYELKSIGEKTVLDLTSASAGTIGEDIYGDYDYDIKMNTYKDAGRSYLSVDVLSTPKKYDGSGYVRDEENNFKAQRSFDLVNMNIGIAKYKLDSLVSNDKNRDFATDPNYTDFPQETNVPTGLTSTQEKYFDTTNTDNRYTYIFFYINRTGMSKCKVNFMYDPMDPNKSYAGHFLDNHEYQVSQGKKLDQTAINALNKLPTRPGYSTYYFTDGNEKIDIADYVINDDITFIVVYEKDAGAIIHTSEYYLPDGTPLTNSLGEPITGEISDGFSASNLPDPTGSYDPITQYYEWYVKGLPHTEENKAENYVVQASTTGGTPERTVEYECEIKNKWKIRFTVDGTDFVDPIYIKDQYEFVTPKDNPTKSTGTGYYVFKGWYYGSQPLNSYLNSMNGDTEFKATFEYHAAPPSPAVSWTLSYTVEDKGSGSYWNGSKNVPMKKYAILPTFTNVVDPSKKLSGYTLKVTLDKPSDVINYSNCTITSNGTKTISFKPSVWNDISSGSTDSMGNNTAGFYFCPKDESGEVNIVNVEIVSVTEK